MLPPPSWSEADVTPPRYCDFSEELVVYDGGINTLGLYLRAICRERSVAHFRYAFMFSFTFIMYTGGLSLS